MKFFRHACLALILLSALSATAAADVVDAMRFHMQQCDVQHAKSGTYTVVHCYSPGCECCQEFARHLENCSHAVGAAFCYVRVESQGKGLPIYEVYDPDGRLKWQGEAALNWIQGKSR